MHIRKKVQKILSEKIKEKEEKWKELKLVHQHLCLIIGKVSCALMIIKKALFKLIAYEVENIVVPNGKAFVIKSEDRALVKGNIRQKDFSIVSIYQKEETDTRVCIHVKCMLSYGHKNVLIATVDTVVAVSLFNQLLSLGFEQLWI